MSIIAESFFYNAVRHQRQPCKTMSGIESQRQKRANNACTRRLGVCAFSSSLRGFELVPSKERYLAPPSRR